MAVICLLVFAVCYFLNISSYEPAPDDADLRRESGLAQSAKSTEEKLDELNDLDAKFDQIPWGLKNRYDVHRLIRRIYLVYAYGLLFCKFFRQRFIRARFSCRDTDFTVYFHENLPKKLPYEKIQQIFHKKSASLFDDFYG